MISALFLGASLVSCGSGGSAESGARSANDPTSLTVEPTTSSAPLPTSVLPATTQLAVADPNDPRLASLSPVTVDDPCPQSNLGAGAGEAMLTESSRLEPMLGQVLAYGGQHADEFGTYGLVWHDGTDASVFISFTSHLGAHRAALDQIVQYPADLIVCQVALPGDVSRALQAKLTIDLDGRFVSIGQGSGPIEIGLPSGEDDLAAELRSRYGDAIEVTVGACPPAFDTATTNC